MRNPNDDSLLDQVLSLCCLSRYIDERESLYFSVLRICARKLVMRALLPNHSRTCNAGKCRIWRLHLFYPWYLTPWNCSRKLGIGERSTELDTPSPSNMYRYTHLSKFDGFMKTWRKFAYSRYYTLTSKRDVKCNGIQSPSVLYSQKRTGSSNGGVFSVNRISEHLGASTMYLILTLADGWNTLRRHRSATVVSISWQRDPFRLTFTLEDYERSERTLSLHRLSHAGFCFT